VALDRKDLAHDDALEFARSRVDRLDFDAAHCQPRAERRRIDSGIHPFTEPGEADAHWSS
jgi:hypothetical protein